jgi:hypothetical protein
MTINSYLYNGLSETLFHINAQTKGIRRRHKKFNTNWSTHLTNSKNCITQWIDSLENTKELQILGAGDLLDFPKTQIIERFNKVYLTDVSLNCLNSWNKLQDMFPKTELIPVFQDISLIIDSWSKSILNLKSHNLEDYLLYLQNIAKISPPKAHTFIKTKNIVSLNLLSQIPIVWQHFIFNFLEKKFNKNKITQSTEKIISAITPSAQQLVDCHLNALIPKNKGSNLIISDIKYFFPQNNQIKFLIVDVKNKKIVPNVKLENITNNNSTVYEQDALFDYNLDKTLKSYNSIIIKPLHSWIWDLVPKNSLSEKQEFHLVTAFELKAK